MRVRFHDVDGGTRITVEHLQLRRYLSGAYCRHGFPLVPCQRRLAEWRRALLESLAGNANA